MPDRVVVVDDHGETAELLAELLSRRGYAASCVTSAAACLESVADGEVAVVVTDIQMREVSGLVLCRRLRDTHPAIRVLVVTGQPGRDFATQANLAGAFDYLQKPVAIAVLERAVARAFDAYRKLSSLEQVEQP